MDLLAKNAGCAPSKQKVTKEQLIGMISSTADMMDEREDIVDFINSKYDDLNGKTKQEIINDLQTFKAEKFTKEVATIATKNGLETAVLQSFIENIINRMIFDGGQLNDLFAPLELGWKTRTQKELALMEDLVPLLKRLAIGREISGLKAWEN
jgi:type I restriction enzyme R subunit